MIRNIFYAGLDVGGTSGRILLCDAQGNLLGETECGGASIYTGGEERAREKYTELVTSALSERGLEPGQCEGICVAASGVDSEPLRECVRNQFVDMGFPAEKVRVFNDCEIFLKAYEAPALILIAGTGSITFGVSRDGTIVRTGGWGHILSDEGSSFSIGLEIVRAVGDHLDGRQMDEILYRMFYESTEIDDLEALNRLLNHNIMTKNAIANLALLAEKALLKGSERAGKILEETSLRLYRLIRDNYRKMTVEDGEHLTIIFWGSVLCKNRIVRERVTGLVKEEIPDAKIRIPEKRAVEIALDTARKGIS